VPVVAAGALMRGDALAPEKDFVGLRRQPREIVADMLWTASGPEQARLNLRQCLWSIRHRAGCGLVQAERQLLRLAENVAVDAREFQSLAGSQARPEMSRCADLYCGELLAGLHSVSPRFDEWLTVERQRLRELAAAALRESGAKDFILRLRLWSTAKWGALNIEFSSQ